MLCRGRIITFYILSLVYNHIFLLLYQVNCGSTRHPRGYQVKWISSTQAGSLVGNAIRHAVSLTVLPRIISAPGDHTGRQRSTRNLRTIVEYVFCNIVLSAVLTKAFQILTHTVRFRYTTVTSFPNTKNIHSKTHPPWKMLPYKIFCYSEPR